MSFENEKIVLENAAFRLVLDKGGCAESLINLSNGEECLSPALRVPIFTVTEDRPFNNELKLTYMNKRTVFGANSLDWDGESLTVGFDLVSFQAVVRVEIKERYMRFVLTDFIADEKEFPQPMSYPPVVEFRLLQLPLPAANSFGQWMNVSHSAQSSVAVMADSQYGVADSMVYGDTRILTLDARRGFKLRSCGAALICSESAELLDAVEDLENDMDLPRGVRSRRSDKINASMYWCENLTPDNVDEHIAYAKKGGFSMMLLYYTCMFKATSGYRLCGDYDYNASYPNGAEDLRRVLDKIKAAGITPGFHFLHTHIGIESRYVTPIADYRLNLTRRFTLSRPMGENDTELYVEESTADVTLCPDCRVLRFDGELISYEGYTEEPPYRFYGCKRGHFGTTVTAHARGTWGGILDISEFGGTSVYLDQNTDLQEEVGAKIAKIYNCGFEYIYMDGSEGVNVPFNFHLSNGQYRQWKMLSPEPLMAEGAAKTHFGWHMLSGANAFDCFGPEIFKEMLIKYPLAQAPITWQEMTRCNFGWWGFVLPHQKGYKEWAGHDTIGTQADMWEFGQSVSIAWRCPMTVQMSLNALKEHPRTDDILETMRRWEEYREKNLMTEAQRKEIISDYHQEHHLLVLADGSLKMVQYAQIPVAGGKCEVRAFVFETNGARWVVYWDGKGESSLSLPLEAKNIELFDEFAGKPVAFEKGEGKAIIPAGCRRYLKTSLSKDEIKAAFEKAVCIDKAAK